MARCSRCMENVNRPAAPGPRPVVVLGATGKTGRRVVQRLGEYGVPVRPASRSNAVRFDWDDESTWPSALEGAGSAYVTYQPDLAEPRAAERIARLTERAVNAGVGRIVLLSGRGEAGARVSEQALLARAPSATVLRCSWFFQNFTEGALHDAVLEGVIALPVAATVLEPFIDADDIAEVAVKVLLEDGHEGRIHELTGPRLLSFADVAEELTAATGHPVRFIEVTKTQFVGEAVRAGMPEAEARMLADLFVEVLDGRNAATTPTISRLLGRQPRDFASFVRTAASAQHWTQEWTA